MFVLDTSVLAELRPGKPMPSASVRVWAASVGQGQLFLSAITILEVETGVRRLEAAVPPHGERLRTWFDALRRAFDGRILPFRTETAMHGAPMHGLDALANRDSMIAATALEHGFSLVTRNVQSFEGTGVVVLDPFSFGKRR